MYAFSGYEVHVKRILETEWRDLFIPEIHINQPGMFKRWLCKAHLRPRWKVSFTSEVLFKSKRIPDGKQNIFKL